MNQAISRLSSLSTKSTRKETHNHDEKVHSKGLTKQIKKIIRTSRQAKPPKPFKPCESCTFLHRPTIYNPGEVNRGGGDGWISGYSDDHGCSDQKMIEWLMRDYVAQSGGECATCYPYQSTVHQFTAGTPLIVKISACLYKRELLYPTEVVPISKEAPLEIFTEEEGLKSPWAAIRPWKKLPPLCENSTMRTAAYLDKISSWIAKCGKDHPECGGSDLVRLPMRVLDLGQSGYSRSSDLRLAEPGDIRDRYVCLSHCWGLYQPIKTTRSTLQRFSTRIPYRSLPRTFQDAIDVTRYLGFRYLWIDSLCIVQDDAADWETQAGQMADIYGNAIITIAATVSNGADVGLFQPVKEYLREWQVPENLLPPCSPPVWYRRELSHNALERSAEFPWEETGYITEQDHDWYPLHGRSWTMQEHLLSPRVVQFLRRELVCVRCICSRLTGSLRAFRLQQIEQG